MNPEPRRPQTTAGLQAKVSLRHAWFEAHPNQPMPEGRAQVERLFAAIEAASLDRGELRKAVEALEVHDCVHGIQRQRTGHDVVDRQAVLAHLTGTKP